MKKLSKGILFGESPLLLGSGDGSFSNLQKRAQADHDTHSAPADTFLSEKPFSGRVAVYPI
ncbi:MAG: hypothetical protein R2875_18260 [Desulfobacterales bacterium]